MRPVRLRSRIRSSIIAAALLPSLLLLGAGYVLTWSELKAKDASQQEQRAERLGEKLSHELELLAERADALSEDSDLLRAIQVPIFISKADQRLSDFIVKNPSVQSIGLLDRSGQIITADPIGLETKSSTNPFIGCVDAELSDARISTSNGRVLISLPMSRKVRPVRAERVSPEATLCFNVDWASLLKSTFQKPGELGSVTGLRVQNSAQDTWVFGKPGEASSELLPLRKELTGNQAFTLGISHDPGMRRAWGRIAGLLALGLIGAVAIIAFMSGRLAQAVVDPLIEMTQLVKRYGAGDYSARGQAGPYQELNFLSTTLGNMGGLILKHLESEREHNRAELEALKNQLKPHFLFNSLNSIAASVQTAPEKTLGMIQKLSDLYRRILESSKRPEHGLSDEIAIVRDYLDLEKERYGPRLSYTITVPGSLSGVLIPCLLLQTLMENCVKHGISQSLDGGQVELSVTEQDDGSIHFEIENSGEPLREPLKPGTGLRNTMRRLDLAYPGKHAFEIRRTDRGWTQVAFSLPGKRTSA